MIELSYGEVIAWVLGLFVCTLALVAAVTLVIQSRNVRKRKQHEQERVVKELDRVVLGSYYSIFSGRETNNNPRSLVNRVRAIEDKLDMKVEEPENW